MIQGTLDLSPGPRLQVPWWPRLGLKSFQAWSACLGWLGGLLEPAAELLLAG